MGLIQCILGDDGLLCVRNGIFLCDQQLRDPYAGLMEAGGDQLLFDHGCGRFSSLRDGGIFCKTDPGAGGKYVSELVHSSLVYD